MFWDVTVLSSWIEYSDIDELAASYLATLPPDFHESLGLDPEHAALLKTLLSKNNAPVKTPEEITERMMLPYKNLSPETRSFYQAIAAVMQESLTLDNVACIESGIHGLGHLAAFLPDIAKPILDTFLKNEMPEALRNFALDARKGIIL